MKMYAVKKCKQCGAGFEPKRSTAVYCGAKCRKLAFSLSVPEVSVLSAREISAQEVSAQSDGILAGQRVDIVLKVCGITMHERQCAANNGGRVRKHAVNTGARKSFSELAEHESNRVSLPGDDDYHGRVEDLLPHHALASIEC